MKQYVSSHLRDMNRQVVYQYIMKQDVTSRAEIAKATGISAPTVMKIVEYLEKTGLVRELGKGVTETSGRKPQLIQTDKNAFYIASFVLEGSFLIMGIINCGNEVTFRKVLHVEPDLLKTWSAVENRLLPELLAEAGVPEEKLAGIGFALPVTLNIKTKMIGKSPLINVHSPLCLKDRMISMECRYGVPVFIENDANACCIGERWLRREEDVSDLIYISVGTGIGAGIMIGNKLLRGPGGTAGEVGCSIISAGEADAGSYQGLEQRIGYNALSKHFGPLPDRLSEGTKKQEIIDYVADPLAVMAFNTAMTLGCGRIVLGGQIANVLGDPLIGAVRGILSRIGDYGIRVEKAVSGDSGLVGIARELTDNRIQEILMEG